MGEYNKSLHELAKECKKAVDSEQITDTLFCELLNRFKILLAHYEELEQANLKQVAVLGEHTALQHEMGLFLNQGMALYEKARAQTSPK
jgi:hypothetical protein